MDLQLIADLTPQADTHENGIEQLITLLNALADIPAFAPGWEANGIPLATDTPAFRRALLDQVDEEPNEFTRFFAIAESACSFRGAPIEIERYLITYAYGQATQPQRNLVLKMKSGLADADLLQRIMRVVIGWAPVRHISAGDLYYPIEDSPLDRRRRGIGWAGWVPHTLTADQLASDQISQAAIVTPLGTGTFVATQHAYWSVSDREAVKRARALELRLNDLGLLPTMTELAAGR